MGQVLVELFILH